MKMIGRKYIIAAGATLAMMMGACSDGAWNDEVDVVKYGTLDMTSFSLDVTEEAMSRSGYDVSEFIVEIIDEAGKSVEEYTYSSMPGAIPLPVGAYSVEVRSLDKVEPSTFDEPYYTGTQDFVIKENIVTEVETIVCRLMSTKVSVEFSPYLSAIMGDDSYVIVESDNGGRLVFYKVHVEEGLCGYFDAASGNVIEATFTGTVEGEKLVVKKSEAVTGTGEHHIFKFSVKTADGEN